MRKIAVSVLFGAALSVAAGGALAQAGNYPAKPMRLMVGFAAGGGTDLLGRFMAAKMSEALGQPMIVENKPGAGGTIAAEIVAKAAPDGYTLNAPTNSYTVNAVFLKLPYDPVADITPISMLASSVHLFVVPPSLGVNSLKEFLAQARARPGQLNYGSTGHGAISHLAIELFKHMGKVDLAHVPYKGTSQVLADLLGGQIQFTAAAIPAVMPLVKSGKLKVLGVSTLARSKHVPDVPTVSEGGVPGYDVASWYAFSGPPKLPRDIVNRLNETIGKILATPEAAGFFDKQGVDVAFSSPEAFAKILKSDIDMWSRISKVVTIQ
jgi:tripartite-type tricarboxylate transporter receptor subunit TctC